MKMKKTPFIFGGILLVEAMVFAFAMTKIVSYDNTILLLFPGVWAFFDGVTVVAIFWFGAITLVTYLMGGLILALIYFVLQKIASRRIALIVTMLVPLCVFAAIAYSEKKQHDEFFHVGDTPADCAQLEPSQQNWCYRTIYQRYPTAEVCSKLEYGEETQCWQLCQAAGNADCK
jgi:hypothetical protein